MQRLKLRGMSIPHRGTSRSWVTVAILFCTWSAAASAAPEDVTVPAPFGPLPSARQMRWHEREYYGFIHFTINTFTNKEWGMGDKSKDLFQPSELDCRQWARVFQAAGMRGMILTCKHHDGFCLWPSRYTQHSVGHTACQGKRDVVREAADACREYGLAFGVYLSPWDRNHAEYGRAAYID